MFKFAVLAAVALTASNVEAAAGFLPSVSFDGASCSGNGIRGFAPGGPTDFGRFTNCSEYVQGTPGVSAIVDRCSIVPGSDGRFSQKTQCYGNDTFMPCFANLTQPPRGYGVFNIHTDAACTQYNTAASPFVGSVAILEGQCQPFNLGEPSNPPFIRVNCTTGSENFRLFADGNCTTPFPGAGANNLNGQCNAFGFISGSFIRGRCNQCPPLPPPPPPPEGLSGGAIAGIVIGALAALAALGGLAYALTRRKTEPTPDLPLEASKPVTTVKEVTVQKPVEVVTKEVVTQSVAPVATQTVVQSVAPVVAATTVAAAAPAVVQEVTSYTTTTETVPTATTYTTTTTEAVPATTSYTTTTSASSAGLNPINQYAVGSQYTAAGAYVATKPTELNVRLGDFIRVEEVNAEGWIKGVNVSTGSSGWFPLAALKGGY